MPDSPQSEEIAIPGLKERPGGQFAVILIQDGVMTVADVKKAMRVQEKLGSSKLVSTILTELGMLTEGEHRRIIRKHGREFRIGELICELGYITLQQLQQAEKKLATSPGKRIGAVIREMGLIEDRQLAQALSEQLAMPLIHLDIDTADRMVLTQFAIKFMRMHLTVPYEASGSKVSIATANPLNNTAIAEIEKRMQKKAVVSIAAESAILSLLSKLESAGGKGGEAKDQVADVVDSILLSAIRDHASDIHIEPMDGLARVRFRLDGVLIHKMDLPSELSQRVLARLKVLAEMDISDSRRHQDGRFTREVSNVRADYRVSTYVTIYGENMVMRILRSSGGIKNIEQISMSRGVLDRFKHEALDVPTGVVLITGPTGSGKTSTLYAAVDYLNRPTTKIITVEDPVEFIVPGIMQCSVDATAGRSFDQSLKAMMRQDPDIIVMGEVRDRPSAQVAVQAALTGHKVLTTFHTEDSIGGLLRLIDMGIETFLISSTVVSILAQRLIRTICPECRQAYMPNKRIANLIGIDDETLRTNTFYRGTGCGTCYGTGYHGRTALHELLVLNEDVREAILARKSSHDIRQISCETTNLLSLMEDGMYKVLLGLTTAEEVYRIAPRSLSTRSVEDIYRLMGHGE
ncbi:type II/IV secretion system protein [Mariprofundus sp. NF]|uniref:GspE/PulE family protein n=1 Tax=Mariprofundus sp. NF TaxID=2608716 RepID=UPI0015A08827|nr:GspE/PulE family protein [Mariprofundus sp. NF]NWF39068.1 type II/IV secretion system protein [Mariprofundus sp. NF]